MPLERRRSNHDTVIAMIRVSGFTGHRTPPPTRTMPEPGRVWLDPAETIGYGRALLRP